MLNGWRIRCSYGSSCDSSMWFCVDVFCEEGWIPRMLVISVRTSWKHACEYDVFDICGKTNTPKQNCVTTWLWNRLTKIWWTDFVVECEQSKMFRGEKHGWWQGTDAVHGYFKYVRRGRQVILVGVVCNNVKCARGAHFCRLSKIVPKGADSHANRG
jgi:hypothetical protein